MYLRFARSQELGGKLGELEFNRAVIAACSKIDGMTFNRLRAFFSADPPADNPLRVKVEYLACELIERGLTGRLDGRDIASQSSGRVSISYESAANKAGEIIRAYLQNESVGGAPLMYAGRA
jgi:hypothetical protein